jgi:peptide deformylase
MTQPEPLEIVLYPEPSLKQKCRALTAEEIKAGKADKWDLAELSARMHATMYAAEGIGLAAPQVGVSLRIFCADISKDKSGVFTILNPVLSEMKGSVVEEEGCLSIPHVRAKVKRYAALKIDGVDLKGQPISFEANDLLARVCQHETDHLDGILFINKIGMTARLLVRKQLIELEEDFQLAQKRKK